MRILFLTNLLPYPLDNGGKIKTYTTINALAMAGHQIDLVCFTEKKNNLEEKNTQLLQICNRVEQVYQRLTTAENRKYMMQLAVKSLFSKYSLGLFKYQSHVMKDKLNDLCAEYKYECIYFDHLQMCVYEEQIRKLLPDVKMILDEHNCESMIVIRSASAAKNLLKKFFLKIESKKLGLFEARMLQKMDTSIVLSKEDYAELRKQCKRDFSHTIIPIGVQDRGIRRNGKKHEQELRILFLGTLTWEPNNQGLIWFLSKVVPLLLEENFRFRLYIVGKNPSDEVKRLAGKYDNISITGYVESVDEYYDMCDCMIVPLFIGSGQRVKLIEGFSKGMPAVSTRIGAEGLDVIDKKNILIADTASDFRKALYEMKNEDIRSNVARNARKTYEAYYSPASISEKLNNVVNTVLYS